jgi:hypothetical protein
VYFTREDVRYSEAKEGLIWRTNGKSTGGGGAFCEFDLQEIYFQLDGPESRVAFAAFCSTFGVLLEVHRTGIGYLLLCAY